MISADAIRNCANYVVDSPNGRIGTVTEIRYDVPAGVKPAALVVRAGRNGTRLLVIPVSELASIRTTPRRVVVHKSFQIIATEAPAEQASRAANLGEI